MGDLLARFKDHLVTLGISDGSIRNYLSDLNHFQNWLSSSYPKQSFAEINSEHPLAYRTYLVHELEAPVSSVNRRLSSLRQFFTWAVTQNLLSSHPMEGLSNISIRGGSTDIPSAQAPSVPVAISVSEQKVASIPTRTHVFPFKKAALAVLALVILVLASLNAPNFLSGGVVTEILTVFRIPPSETTLDPQTTSVQEITQNKRLDTLDKSTQELSFEQQRLEQDQQSTRDFAVNTQGELENFDSTTENSIQNSSFELNSSGAPEKWQYFNFSNSFNTIVTQEAAHTGSNVLRFSLEGIKYGGLMQSQSKTRSDSASALSVWVRGSGLSWNGLVKLGFKDDSGKYAAFQDFHLGGTFGWQRLTVSANGQGLYPAIEFRGYSAGTAYLDDWQVTSGRNQVKYAENRSSGQGSVETTGRAEVAPVLSDTGSLGTALSRFGSLYLSGATIDSSGNVSISGTTTTKAVLPITGKAYDLGSSAYYYRTVYAQSIVADGTTIGGDQTILGNLTVGGTSTLIGNVSAVNNLSVAGTATLTGLLTANGGIITNNASINTGSGSISGGSIAGATLTTTGNTSVGGTLTVSSTINTNTFNATSLGFSGASPVITTSSLNSSISLEANGSGLVNIGALSTGDINIGGGSGSTGCTIFNSSGNLTCTGNILGAATGTVGYWTRTGTILSPATSGDSVTTSGNISSTGSGTVTSAGLLTASNGLTLSTGVLNLTSTSGAVSLTLSSSLTAFNVNSGLFNLDTTNSRVGIGTSVPGAKLEVNQAGTGDIIRFAQGGSTKAYFDNSGNFLPGLNAAYDIGSPGLYWDDGYFDNITANNINATTTTIAGTTSSTFTINTDNATSDLEDMDLIFFRGTATPPNSLLSWKSTPKEFQLNYGTLIYGQGSVPANSVLTVRGASGQTGDIFRVQNSTPSDFFKIGANGALTATGAASFGSTGSFASTLTASNGFTLTTGAINLTSTSGSVSLIAGGADASLDLKADDTLRSFTLSNTGADTVAAGAPEAKLVVKGGTNQAGNLVELQNAAGTVLAKFAANGDLTLGPTGNGKITVGVVDPYLITNTGTVQSYLEFRNTATAGADDFVFTLGGAERARLTETGNLTVVGTLTAQSTNTSTFAGPVDMQNNVILNIGNAGTDFTSTGGLSLAGVLAIGSAPAASGSIRLPNNGQIVSRNAANSADISLAFVDGSNNANFNSGSVINFLVGGTAVAHIGSSYLDIGTTPATTGVIRIPTGLKISSRNAANTADLGLLYGSTVDSARIDVPLTVAGNYIEVGGQGIAGSGVFRMPNATNVVARNFANTGDVNVIGVNTSDNVLIRQGTGQTVVGDGFLSVGATPATTGVLRIPNNTQLAARNAASTADVPIIQLDTGNVVQIAPNGQQVNVSAAQIQMGSGFLSVGTTPATTGVIRIPNNSTLSARNAANTADVSLIAASGSNEVEVGKTNSALVNLGANWFIVSGTAASLSSTLAIGTTPATTGAIRVPNATAIYGRNAANTANYQLIGINAGNNIIVGNGGGSDLTVYSDGGAISVGSTAATTGTVRLPSNTGINFRNAANTANIRLVGSDANNDILLGDANTTRAYLSKGATGGAGIFVLPNNGSIRGTNAAGTSEISMLSINTDDTIDINTSATATRFGGNVSIVAGTSPSTRLDVLGLTLSTDADNKVGVANLTNSLTKNDALTKTFSSLMIKPTFNTGASNTTTTYNVLSIDTVNTAVTGLTTNLISAAYGGTVNFKVASSGNVTVGATGTGKLTVGTVDPLYNIDGVRYSTYAPSMLGVKEEITGDVTLSYDSANNNYSHTINLANASQGSDLWVFARVSDPDVNMTTVLVSASTSARVWYLKDASRRSITFFSDRATSVSYRLTAPRFDHLSWGTLSEDQETVGMIAPAQAPVGSESGSLAINSYFGAFSENFNTVGTVTAGDLLSVDQASSGGKLTRSNGAYDAKLTGVATSDGPIATVTSAGRVQVRVSVENGNITPGDHLTSSATKPGWAMRATQAGRTIGVALQPLTGTDGTILVSVTPSWFDPAAPIYNPNGTVAPTSSSGSATYDTLTATTANIANLNVGGVAIVTDSSGNLKVNGNVIVTGKGTFAEVRVNGLLTLMGGISAPSGLAVNLGLSKAFEIKNSAGEVAASISDQGALIARSAEVNELKVSTASAQPTTGVTIFRAGGTSMLIETTKITGTSKVIVTFKGNYAPATRYWTSDEVPGESFTLHLDQAPTSDVSFNWWIIN